MHATARELLTSASKIFFDREHEISLAFCCLLADGHLLVEDTPGVGKTTLVKILGRLLGLECRRIQFTNDLLPSDILGSMVFDPSEQTFKFHKGPIFAQIVLGDELNRASARTQSATLQAMEEREVSIDGKTYALPRPFFFIGTVNPREQAGTAQLPESQTDRFLMRLNLRPPDRGTQRKLLLRQQSGADGRIIDFDSVPSVLTIDRFFELQKSVLSVTVSEAVREYILDLSEASAGRGWQVSPRAVIGLQRAAQAWALISGRNHVLPDDVQAIFVPVMSHRLVIFAGRKSDSSEGLQMARELLENTQVR